MLYPIQNDVRNRLDLSGIWDFKIDPDEVGERDGWFDGLTHARAIAVPGSWNEQYEDLFNYLGLAWYVRRAYIPRGWRGERIFVRVGSANYHGTVYVNGAMVGSHEGGHLPFAFEITELVRWDEENIIAVSVENRLLPARVPSGNIASALGSFASFPRTTFDFFPYAGIHRPVVLYSVPQEHIEDVTVVTGIEGADGWVRVTARLNTPVAARGVIRLEGGDSAVEADLAFAGGAAEAELAVPGARFWSDTDPYLYELTVETESDRYALRVGIRTVEVRGPEILLNGRPVKLNGYGRHEDFYASGRGLNLPLLVKDYGLMGWTGANSYRTSHYPYSEEEMQLADREGFLVIDEIPAVSLQFDNEGNIAERMRVCRRQIEELIARDKNHPSVVMWSVANEPQPRSLNLGTIGGENEDPSVAWGKDFLDTLVRHARALDPTRLVTLVGLMGGPVDWLRECDVACINRYWGWYIDGGELEKGLAHLEQELDATWETLHKPVVVTEFGADTMAGLHGLPPLMWTEEYQAEYIRGHLEVAARKEFVAGMQVWNFADFAAVQSVMRVGGLNLKGVFTRARQPKLAAHVLRELWVKPAHTSPDPEKVEYRESRHRARPDASRRYLG
jgi:beta-glucuronidase